MDESDKKVKKKGRGGARKGAGRKPLPGAFMTTIILTEDLRPKLKKLGGSKWIRCQIQKAEEVPFQRSEELPPGAMLVAQPMKKMPLPLADFRVQAGSPSPTESYLSGTLDLNEFAINSPGRTFFVRAKGDSMDKAGIDEGSLLVVDRDRPAQHGDIVVMRINDDFTVKRLYHKDNIVKLVAESNNPTYQDVVPETLDAWFLVGVVRFVLKEF